MVEFPFVVCIHEVYICISLVRLIKAVVIHKLTFSGEVLKVNVKEPSQGSLPPKRTQTKSAAHEPNKVS